MDDQTKQQSPNVLSDSEFAAAIFALRRHGKAPEDEDGWRMFKDDMDTLASRYGRKPVYDALTKWRRTQRFFPVSVDIEDMIEKPSINPAPRLVREPGEEYFGIRELAAKMRELNEKRSMTNLAAQVLMNDAERIRAANSRKRRAE